MDPPPLRYHARGRSRYGPESYLELGLEVLVQRLEGFREEPAHPWEFDRLGYSCLLFENILVILASLLIPTTRFLGKYAT